MLFAPLHRSASAHMGRSLVVVFGLFLSCAACGNRVAAPVVLATTTSVANSGLLERLLPAYPERLRTVAVGSGLALELLDDGNADVAITHAPEREAAALHSHPYWRYRKVLYNEFLLVGPAEDPARAGQAADVVAAMRRIADSRHTFISRGDHSGTHDRERQLWAAAGVTPAGQNVVIAGAGMGQTLRIASNTNAYTLTDSGTFAALQRSIRSRVLFRGGERLLNTYAVTFDAENERGRRFAEWLVDGDGRTILQRTVATEVQGFSIWPSGSPRDRPESRPH